MKNEKQMQTMSYNNVKFALETAMAAARETGRYLIEKQGSAHILYEKSLHDDLLDADLGAESILLNILREHFPAASILSEEAGAINGESGYQWIVDPLDGSDNFQHQDPSFGISICLRINNISTLGVIYLPIRDEMFTSVLGQGTALNNRPIHVSSVSTLKDARIQVGDFAKTGDYSKNERRGEIITRLGHTVRRVRMIGTAMTDLAYVACGRADALVMFSADPWHHEISRLLVTEAGGEVSILKDNSGKVLAIYSNGAIHQQLVELLVSNGTFLLSM